jgi:hypothetical protein
VRQTGEEGVEGARLRRLGQRRRLDDGREATHRRIEARIIALAG